MAPNRGSNAADRRYGPPRRAASLRGTIIVEVCARDGTRYRHWGRTVSWTDRRGLRGATYDVDPNGRTATDNLLYGPYLPLLVAHLPSAEAGDVASITATLAAYGTGRQPGRHGCLTGVDEAESSPTYRR